MMWTVEQCEPFANLYAIDGRCHNVVSRGTFNHECSKPATCIGVTKGGFASGFCDRCRRNGRGEVRSVVEWKALPA